MITIAGHEVVQDPINIDDGALDNISNNETLYATNSSSLSGLFNESMTNNGTSFVIPGRGDGVLDLTYDPTNIDGGGSSNNDLLIDDNGIQVIPNNHFVLLVVGMAGLFFLVACVCVVVRDYCWKKYSIDICFGNGPQRAHNANTSSATPWSMDYYGASTFVHQEILRARRAALLEELRNNVNNGGGHRRGSGPDFEEQNRRREEAVVKRREARRIWYEGYLKPYTMVVEEKDIVYASLDENAASTAVASASNVDGPPPPNSEDDGISLEDHEFVDIDIEMGSPSSNNDHYAVVVNNHHDEYSERTDRTVDMYGSNEEEHHHSPHYNDSGRHGHHDDDEEETNEEEPQSQDSGGRCVRSIEEKTKTECSMKNNIDYEVEDLEAGGDNTVCCLKVPIKTSNDDAGKDNISIEEGDADITNNDGDDDDENDLVTRKDDTTSQTHRCVDICCSICLGEYEVGDHVVFSSQKECQHVFHEECIIQWLCKGKKRCPICRHWFVPGISIAEQKAQAEAVALVQQAIDNEQQLQRQQRETSANAATATGTDGSGADDENDEIQYDVDEEEGDGGGTAAAAQNRTEEVPSAIETLVDVTSAIEAQV